jgi:hypothetical protein
MSKADQIPVKPLVDFNSGVGASAANAFFVSARIRLYSQFSVWDGSPEEHLYV